MKACFIGLGYIGLPTAIIAAKSGIEVIASISSLAMKSLAFWKAFREITAAISSKNS